jgi:hypothetical protein
MRWESRGSPLVRAPLLSHAPRVAAPGPAALLRRIVMRPAAPRPVFLAALVALLLALLVGLGLVFLAGGEEAPPPAGGTAQAGAAASAENPVARSAELPTSLPAASSVRSALPGSFDRRRRVTVRGFVTWPDGVRAHGTTVAHDPDAGGGDAVERFSDVRTAHDGSFTVQASSGIFALRAMAGDCISEATLVDARHGDVAGVGIAMPRLPRVRGSVVDVLGNPVVADLRVVVDTALRDRKGQLERSQKKEFLRSTPAGEFRREIPLRYPLGVRAFAPGHADSDEHRFAPGERADELRIVLAPLRDLALEVLRSDRTARPGLQIGWRDPRPERGIVAAFAWGARTDERGELVLRNVPALPVIELALRQAERGGVARVAVDARVPSHELVIDDGQLEHAVVDVALTGEVSERGTYLVRAWAVEPTGSLGPKLTAESEVKERVARFDTLDVAQRYRFAVVASMRAAPGPEPRDRRAEAFARRAGAAESAVGQTLLGVVEHTTERGEQRVELVVEARGQLEVFVRDLIGAARAGALVTCTGPSTTAREPFACQSDARGHVAFADLLPGEYHVEAYDDVASFAAAEVTVVAARPAAVILQRTR